MTTKKIRQQTEEDVNDFINSMTDTELLHWKRISEQSGKIIYMYCEVLHIR